MTNEKLHALPLGFLAGAVSCGVKNPNSPKLDLCLFMSERPCMAAGVFTTNLVCGAPVKVSRSRLPRTTARAVVLNSGNSNAATGERGIKDAETMTALVAEQIGCAAEDVLVCSTGVIGRFLPMDRLSAGIPKVAKAVSKEPKDFLLAAQAMMTTDTVHKQASIEVQIGDDKVRISGACKGAAMIAPNMATMLCVIMTDAVLSKNYADSMLKTAVADSFNCISVDGHESTSDSVILLANGASGVTLTNAEDVHAFQLALNSVAGELAQAIIHDAEGASHFIRIDVTGARTRAEAFQIARTVAESPLVKTAITGGDPNWGRIVSAAGYAGVPLQETDMTLVLNGFLLYEDGAPVGFEEKTVSESMKQNRDVLIELKLKHGNGRVTFYTADLTKEYVELNADYTT